MTGSPAGSPPGLVKVAIRSAVVLLIVGLNANGWGETRKSAGPGRKQTGGKLPKSSGKATPFAPTSWEKVVCSLKPPGLLVILAAATALRKKWIISESKAEQHP